MTILMEEILAKLDSKTRERVQSAVDVKIIKQNKIDTKFIFKKTIKNILL